MKPQNSSSSQPDPVKIKYCGCNDETCSPDDCLFCSPTGYEDCPVCSPFECLTKCKSCEECDGSGECINICDTQNCEECVEFEENGQTISRCESKCGQNECCNGSGECRPCGCESNEGCQYEMLGPVGNENCPGFASYYWFATFDDAIAFGNSLSNECGPFVATPVFGNCCNGVCYPLLDSLPFGTDEDISSSSSTFNCP